MAVVFCLGFLVSRVSWEQIRSAASQASGWGLLLVGLCWGVGRLVSVARYHLLLRGSGVSVHSSATARVLLAEPWLRWLPRLVPAAAGFREGLYAAWFEVAQERLTAATQLDRLLALDWVSWYLRGGRLSSEQDPGVTISPATLWCIWLDWVLDSLTVFFAVSSFSSVAVSWLWWAWVLPVAVVVRGLTPAFGGLGPRELLLWAMLIPVRVDAVAILWAGTSLFAVHLAGATIGLVALRAELRRRSRSPHPSPPTSISVIIPTLNEAQTLEETIRRVREIPEVVEILVVDGGSTDGTQLLSISLGCPSIPCVPGRGGQLRTGARRAKGDVLLLLHADTWLEPDAGQVIFRCLQDPVVVAGGFWKRFRQPPRLLLGSRFKCAIRVWLGHRVVGDMAMFVRRDALRQIGGVPDIELMEDFELSRLLIKHGRLALADGVVTTSPRRFVQHGVIATYFKMWQITTLYRLGRPPAELRRLYG